MPSRKYATNGPDARDARDYAVWLEHEFGGVVTVTSRPYCGNGKSTLWELEGVMVPRDRLSVPLHMQRQARARVVYPSARCAGLGAALYWLMSDLHQAADHHWYKREPLMD